MIRQRHHIIRAVVLGVALAATAAPCAWADPQPLAKAESANMQTHTPATTAPCGDVCSGHGYGTPPVTRAAVATTAPCGDVCSGHGYGTPPVTRAAVATPAPCGDVWSGHGYGCANVTASLLRVQPHSIASSDGFDWADAGIGAGAALVLAATGLGVIRAATSSRKRHIGEQRLTATS